MSSPPRLSAHLQPLAALVWPWFLVWTGLAFVVMPFYVGESQVREWVSNPGLSAALVQGLAWFDRIWIVLAAANLYFYTATAEGLATSRRWAIRILGGASVLAWIGATTAFPFGHFAYTERLGYRIGHVLPFGVPLLWLVVILGSRYTVLSLCANATRWPRWQLALGTAAVALLTDLNLEFVAWKARSYWIWYPFPDQGAAWPPVQNFAAWFVAAFLFSLALRTRQARSPAPAQHRHLRPMLILGLMNAVFLAVHVFSFI